MSRTKGKLSVRPSPLGGEELTDLRMKARTASFALSHARQRHLAVRRTSRTTVMSLAAVQDSP